MHRVLVVCGAGASSTFLVHAMRREILARGSSLVVEAVSLEGLPRAARGVALVLVANHLEADIVGIRSTLPSATPIEVLPALSPMGTGPAIAVDIADRALSPAAAVSIPAIPGGSHA